MSSKTKILIGIIAMVVGVLVGWFALHTTKVEAATQVLCHQHTGNGCMEQWRSSCNSGQGWHSGGCPQPTATPTPTPRPTATPTPTPKPTATPTPTPSLVWCHRWDDGKCEDEKRTHCGRGWSEGQCVKPTPTPTIDPCENDGCVTPTPTPEVTVTPAPPAGPPGNPPTFAGSSTEPPVCGDKSTVNLPANPHVVRKGTEATVNFFITEGDRANIYYRVVGQSNWQYSVVDVKPNGDKFVSYTINGLDANLGYDFGIQQVQGCGGGQLVTVVIVDGPEEQTFGFSYWEWSK